MTQEEKLTYRIAINYESDHPIEATSPEEAIKIWQHEFKLEHIPYKIKAKEWVKGGYRLVLELQEHLNQVNRDALGESITIENISKSGENVTSDSSHTTS